MTEPLNDKQLKANFRQLRATEMKAAPDYRTSLANPFQAAPRKRFRPEMQFVIASAALVVVVAAFLKMDRNQSMPETAETAPPLLQEADLVANLEMPTDFLLDTPWFDLARTTPDFDFEFPQYDFPEELSDEI